MKKKSIKTTEIVLDWVWENYIQHPFTIHKVFGATRANL